MNDIEIVEAGTERLAEIMEIENSVFSVPWPEDFMRSHLEGECYTVFAALYGGRTVGYLSLMSVLDEGEIQNVAVAPDARRRGIGRALLAEAVAVSLRRGIKYLYLDVRESNESARALYRSQGFADIGRRRGYYDEPDEDAILMSRNITLPRGRLPEHGNNI